ncbi:unnamed protein product [Gordionus sp. m RMFG-2023]
MHSNNSLSKSQNKEILLEVKVDMGRDENTQQINQGTSDFFSHDEESSLSTVNSDQSDSESIQFSSTSYSCCSQCSCTTISCFETSDSDMDDTFSDLTNVSPLPPSCLSPLLPSRKDSIVINEISKLPPKNGEKLPKFSYNNIDMDSLIKALLKLSLEAKERDKTILDKQSNYSKMIGFKVLKPCCRHILPFYYHHFDKRHSSNKKKKEDKIILKSSKSHHYSTCILLRFDKKKCIHAKNNAKLFSKTARKLARHRSVKCGCRVIRGDDDSDAPEDKSPRFCDRRFQRPGPKGENNFAIYYALKRLIVDGNNIATKHRTLRRNTESRDLDTYYHPFLRGNV